jgi:hypothetical protein
MTRSRNVLRFASGTDLGPRSAVWRIHSHGDEVYVQSRYAGGELKASLHKSGDFREAFSREKALKWVGTGDRVIRRWREPKPEPGTARLLLQVRMPTHELTSPVEEPSEGEKAKVKLIDPAPPGWETVVSLYLLPPGEDDIVGTGHAKLGEREMELIANWQLPTRGRLLIFSENLLLPPEFSAQIEEARRDIVRQFDPASLPSDGHPRVMLMAHDANNAVASYVDLAADFLVAESESEASQVGT